MIGPTSVAPETLFQYRILHKLGAGGMGEVYLARDTRLERDVALKILKPEMATDPDRLRRFLREARAASALSHPNVAQVYEIGEAQGLSFIAMEYVDGDTLAARLEGGPLPIADILDVGLSVSDALDEAHARGIIHRDIKPANIMISRRGRVKVLDFGLVKLTRPLNATAELDRSSSTTTGVILGTLDYLSPEQALGRELDHRTDVFSLGIVLYQLTSGRLPFAAESLGEMLDHLLHREPPAFDDRNGALPADFARVVRKCLEKEPDRRYQSTRELLVDLRNIQRDSDPERRVHAAPMMLAPRERGLLTRAFAWLSPNPRRWWEIDHLVVILFFTPFWIYAGWVVRASTPGRLGLAAFLSVLLGQAVRTTLRLYLLVGSFALRPGSFLGEVKRIQPWMRWADVFTLAVIFGMVVLVFESRLGLAATMLGIAIAWLVKILLADAAITREAFRTEEE